MTKYQVRSRELIDVVNEIRSRRLIMSPYFQRNLVWRLIHKIDFIKTILLGYPFPQIFIARGTIDLESMTTTSCIVDGQQRMNAITEYIKDEFKVDDKFFSDLNITEKENFLKYQIPIIDLDISNDDPEIIEIFQRLNRTFYSLSGIEKISTEYASSEFMLLAKYMINEVKFSSNGEEDFPLQLDPNIPNSFIEWTKNNQVSNFNKLILEEGIFTPYELTRQVHLNFTLNLFSTYLDDFYNRNDFVDKNLEEFADNFPKKDEVFQIFENVANKFTKLKFKKKSYWLNKANSFSIICLLSKNWNTISEVDEKLIKEKLENFENNLPEEYRIAAKEGVNNKKERLIRNKYLKEVLDL